MDKHTPTPIESLKDALKPMTKEDEFKKVIPLMPISLEVTQCARTIICNCLGEAWKWETQDEYERQVNLFAAYIVRAVNAHQELLSSLRSIIDGYLTLCERFNLENRDPALTQAYRAIAKAEERP